MSHLHETGQSYLMHLLRAWKIAFTLLVHGVFPNIWKTKASDMLCKERLGDDATRAYLLKHMYGIDEKKDAMYDGMKKWEYPWIKKEAEEKTPSIYERMSDRELATWIAGGKKKNQTNAAGYLVKSK